MNETNKVLPGIDPITRILIDRMLKRELKGLAKYGTTVSGNQLSIDQWITHAVEEALDFATYLERMRSEIAAMIRAEITSLRAQLSRPARVPRLSADEIRAVFDEVMPTLANYEHLAVGVNACIAAAIRAGTGENENP